MIVLTVFVRLIASPWQTRFNLLAASDGFVRDRSVGLW
jgi:hypothetical protein